VDPNDAYVTVGEEYPEPPPETLKAKATWYW
jgi:hypothetical protein